MKRASGHTVGVSGSTRLAIGRRAIAAGRSATPRGRPDDGSAMVLAILLVMLVTLVGAVGVSESLAGTYSSGITNKGVEMVAADRSGADSEVANVEKEASSGSTLTCPSAQVQLDGVGAGAANAESAESYDLTFYAVDTSASAALSDLSGSETTGPRYSCATTPDIPVPASGPWYLAVQSQGATSSGISTGIVAGSSPSVAVVEFSQVSTNSFTDGMYGGEDITTPGDLVMTGSGATYTNGPVDCSSSNDYYAGDVWAAGGTTSGACQVHGNLYVSGNATLTGCTAPDVTGGLYATGNVDMSGGCEVEGPVAADGDVSYSGGAWSEGNIYAYGADAGSTCGSSTCLASGHDPQADNVYSANGDIHDSNAALSGSQYPMTAWPTCPLPAGSAATCSGGELAPFPVQKFPTYSFSASQWPGYVVDTDPYDSKPYSLGGCSSNVDHENYQSNMAKGRPNYRYAAGDATAQVYEDIATASGSPGVVVNTPCAIEVGNAATNGQMTISTNVAIFAQGGFWFGNWATPMTGAGKCTVGSPCDAYFVVPCGAGCDNNGAGPFPSNGSGTGCPSSVTSYPGDIDITDGPDQSLLSFFYTPDNLCASGTPGTKDDPITGQIYVGGNVELSSQLFLDADTLVSSALASASSAWSSSVVELR